ncbi:mitochondrial inner membrane protease subunit 2 [Trichomonascus vanleenenianus]|uniref:endopeptidase catalytic subunit n=1 Tax=Trichomonascus vanleenenianus TaxID=2268995 RepID=UPI003ECA0874
MIIGRLAGPHRYQHNPTGSERMIRKVLIGLSWVPVVVTFNQTVGYVSWVQGSSMKPTLNPEENLGWRDMVWLQKYGQRTPGALKVGDIVMVRSPVDPGKLLVKRILGIGGDEIVPRPDSEYPKSSVRIPPNHIWVEGDNCAHSIDSNAFGPVSLGLVEGKATRVVFPPSRFGIIRGSAGREARKAELEKDL